MTADELASFAQSVSQPIYWAGSKPNTVYELTRTGKGKVSVRYLPAGVKAGAHGANYLIVATYPFAGAFDSLQQSHDGTVWHINNGSIAVVDGTKPKSVHLAFPGVDYQVEVYDPSGQRAIPVSLSGVVRRVSGSGSTGISATTRKLRSRTPSPAHTR